MEAKALTEPPVGKGTQVERIATFLGKRIVYVNEVVEFDSRTLLVMQSIKGPFPMTVSYRFEDGASGSLARIRVQGEAGGFYRLAAPLLSGWSSAPSPTTWIT